ncbi:hypothetical protein [Latilactobacillus phage TMW 1.46 P2]|uniref:hypothetical protein n=1 Tax=Latilactobacillus sakei TaxID=1599 RepID=UPI002072AAE6|nr:hypothetical protein [Latilactobacillus sakei]USF96442.1 hypothetical protein A4W82_06295 [Latilactobacillus sakei]WAX23980.1 hypothetical protein [Latilactobacillus phage TMW 1.46 P2]
MGLFSKFFKSNEVTRQEANLKDVEAQIDDSFSESVDCKLDISPLYSTPVYEGLLVGEIILLDWFNHKKDSADVPEYFTYYGINWTNSLPKLLDRGFLRYSTNSEKLPTILAKDLKDILLNNGQKKSGKKDELVQRIFDNLDESAYMKYVDFNVFTLTETGTKIVEHCQILLWSHKHYQNNALLNPGIMANYIDDSRSNNAIAMDILNKEFERTVNAKHLIKATYPLLNRIDLKLKLGEINSAMDDLLIENLITFSGSTDHNLDSYSFSNKGRFINVQHNLKLSDDDLFIRAGEIFDIFDNRIPGNKLYNDKQEYLNALKVLLNGTMAEFNQLAESLTSRYYNTYEPDFITVLPDNIDPMTGRTIE